MKCVFGSLQHFSNKRCGYDGYGWTTPISGKNKAIMYRKTIGIFAKILKVMRQYFRIVNDYSFMYLGRCIKCEDE